MIALSFASCSKEEGTLKEVPKETKTIRLDVSPFEVVTKSGGLADQRDSINFLEAFVFRSGGVLESYRRYGDTEMKTLGRNNLPLEVTPGEKTIYMVANSKNQDWTGATTVDKFLLVDVPLKGERISYLTMSTVLKVDPDTATVVKVRLKKLVANVVVNSIKTNFAKTPYSGMSLRNAKIYLTNVSGKKTYMGAEPQTPLILNYKGFNAQDAANTFIPNCFSENVHRPVGDAGYSDVHSFYCYENLLAQETDSDKFTRLVLEAELDGHKYYYPIDINQPGYGWTAPLGEKGIKRGTIYTYDIVITGPGSDDPESKITRKTIILDAEAEGFEDGPAFTATF